MIAKLKDKQFISPGYTLYVLEGDEISAVARPGQFLEVRVTKWQYPTMRKPLSIFYAKDDTFGMLVKTGGYGAEQMKFWEIGEDIDIIGPLGQGFRYTEADDNFVLVGGGIGLAPLNFLAQELQKMGKNIHLLYAPARDKAPLDAFTVKTGVNIYLSEDRTTVAADLKNLLASVPNPCGVFTCGPNPFMKLVSDTAYSCGVQAQVSLEMRMHCGMGACMGCVVPIRVGDDFEYKTVCHDGPVFLGEEVIFE